MNIRASELIENLAGFNGKVIIQTLFLRGTHNGKVVDNTTPAEIGAWLKAIERINPSEVMIYTISRDTPEGAALIKVSLIELKGIATLVNSIGIRTKVSG